MRYFVLSLSTVLHLGLTGAVAAKEGHHQRDEPSANIDQNFALISDRSLMGAHEYWAPALTIKLLNPTNMIGNAASFQVASAAPVANEGPSGENLSTAEATETEALPDTTGAPSLNDGLALSDLDLRFIEAVTSGNLEAVNAALTLGANPNLILLDGQPLLHLAMMAGQPEIVTTLLEAGADHVQEYKGKSTLELATDLELWSIVSKIGGKSKADLSRRLIFEAIANNDADALTRLLSDGFNPNVKDEGGNTALLAAITLSTPEVITALLSAGADPAAGSQEGQSPLLLAVVANDADLIGQLTSAGADPNHVYDGLSMLAIAAGVGAEAVNALLKAGANPKQADGSGIYPADIAWVLGKADLTAALGGTRITQTQQSKTLLDAIAVGEEKAILNALKSESPNQVTEDKTPYLHLVLTSVQSLDAVKSFLRDTRVPYFAKDTYGRTFVDAVLARPNASLGVRLDLISFIVANANRRSTNMREFWLSRDKAGRSVINRLVVGMPEEWNEGELYRSDLKRLLGIQGSMKTIMTAEDGTGLSALRAAVLTSRGGIIKQLRRDSDFETAFFTGSPSLHDIARAQNDEHIFRNLPYDRFPPAGLQKGASLSSKKSFQSFLKQLGYYSGTIDGKLGPQSRAAVKAYLLDIDKDLKRFGEKVVEDNPTSVEIGVDYYFARLFKTMYPTGDTPCTFKSVRWRQSANDNRRNQSKHLIGCFGSGPNWNSNGFAFVEYETSENVIFTGPNGWDDDVQMR